MTSETSIESTRRQLKSLAEELVKLADTYEPTAPGIWTVKNPFVNKARNLVSQAQTPVDHAMTLCCTNMEAASIKTLLSINALQAIPTNGSISLSELSQKTRASAALQERLLRMVTGSGFIHRDNQGNYSHSHLSAGYTDESIATRLFTVCYEGGLEKLIHLPEYLEHQRKATGRIEEPGASRDNTVWNPTTWQAGVEGQKHTYDIMQGDKEKMQKFQKGLNMTAQLNPYTGYYDFSKLATDEPGRVVLVDVGGGHGHAIQNILAAHPEIKPEQCVLEDFRDVVEFAKQANADLPKGVNFQPHDFFLEPQPVKGARAYYFRAIAHNLSDANFVKVLRNVAAVMEKDSKTLIAENIIPEHGASERAPMMDVMMMMIGGKERTERNMRESCDAAGLKVDKIWHAGGKGTYAITEASLM